ncbi:MAG: ABC transporter ATP-binding protein [bacterium]|nr:ABC transporter ATP-binding protein [bacterium]
MALVEFSSLSKAFGNDEVLIDLDWSVEAGEFAVLFGQGATGKSVLLRTLVGLETPDAGDVTIRGVDAATLKPGDRKIGYVPQSFALFPEKTIFNNIAYPLQVQKVDAGIQKESVERVAALLDISELLDRLPGQLSGGQKQRVAIARGMAPDTELYVLDDPLVGLDFKLREKLIDDLRKTREALGATFLYATSDATEALALGSKVAVLADGKIVEYGHPMEIYSSPGAVATMSYLCFPATNQLPAEVTAEQLSSAWGSVPVVLDEKIESGHEIVAMVRPEHVELSAAQGSQPIGGEATVTLREDLGAEEIVYLESNGSSFIALVRADAADLEALELGKTVNFGVAAESVLLFADGHRVGHGKG